jgi:hypothetical protein
MVLSHSALVERLVPEEPLAVRAAKGEPMPKTTLRSKTSKSRSPRDLSRLQDLQVSTVRRVSETFARVVPPWPSAPLAGRLPSAERVVNDNFNRARRLLENQRRFALALVGAAEPMRQKFGARQGPKRKPTATPTPATSPVKVKPRRRSEQREVS